MGSAGCDVAGAGEETFSGTTLGTTTCGIATRGIAGTDSAIEPFSTFGGSDRVATVVWTTAD